jgi:hypothetical protein
MGRIEPHLAAGQLESRLEFETLISDLSSRFINLPAGDVDREWEMKDLPRSRI